ncbi:MAG: TIGR02302 family protein [Pseudomonadota bacterium]|nr:TIGR02302 family protein [Pseudomonadota bacterium]
MSDESHPAGAAPREPGRLSAEEFARMAAVEARIKAETTRALRALWLERLTLAVWPAWAVIAAFAGLALAGGFEAMPRAAHIVALIAFAAALAGAVWWGFRGFARPDAAQARAALEVETPDRPIAALDDELAIGRADAGARAVWETHRRRMAERAGLLRARAADLRVAHRDPMALRLAALILLVFGILAAAGSGGGRIVQAFDPGSGASGPAAIPTTVEAWASPPAYTGAPMIYLTEKLGETVTLPAGSRLSLRVYNAPEQPALTQGVGDPAAGLTPFGEGAWDLAVEATGSGPLAVAVGGETLASWSLQVIEDAPPSIAFDHETAPAIDAAETGALQVRFAAEDDHGLTAGWAVIALDLDRLGAHPGMLPPPPGLAEPIEVELPLPLTGAAKSVREALIEDLTEHPWAGLPVKISLHAEDASGQQTATAPAPALLPSRPFYDPMARALVEERRSMAWSLSNLFPARQRIRAITAFPDEYFDGAAGPYLLIRTALRRLDYALEAGTSAEAAPEVMDMLWRAALMLEEGDVNSAAERLRRAKERLSEALERGADPDEISRLMDEMRQAMNEYLREMARQALQNLDQLDQQGEQRGQRMQSQDLQEMLDEIERMARDGDPETAQQMLERLAQMLQNLQMQAQRGQNGQSGEGQQTLDELNDMLRQQQDLADRSFEEMQRRQGQGQGQQQGEGQDGQQGQPGQGGQPGGQGGRQFGQQGQGERGVPGQGGRQPGGLQDEAQRQEALRQLLDDLRDQLPGGLSPEAEQALRDADRAMDEARGELEGDAPGEALDDQVRAMENLREGARQLGDALRQQARNGQGDRAGQGDPNAADEGRDPLGRPTANRGALEGSDTEVPGAEALKRARELLDEIRRRSGDRTRPELELEYLRRLLERF